MVKLTEQQKAMLEALEKKPDQEIDYSDIPQTLDWSKAKTGLFYRPVKQEITLKLDEYVIDWFKDNLPDEQELDEAMNQALMDHIYRIRFPKRIKATEDAAKQTAD
jgi:uncharacterized protein (DUF4415 family)